MSKIIVAAIEAGGTTFVVCTAEISTGSKPKVLHRREVDSSHSKPAVTIQECVDFFLEFKPENGYDALGIATFGPVGLKPNSKQYGCILQSSPKAAWRNVNLLEPFIKACRGTKKLAVKIETDVNAPAFAEYLATKDASSNPNPSSLAPAFPASSNPNRNPNPNPSSLAYITVGTGVGVGLVINHETVHGLIHPECGHLPLNKDCCSTSFSGYSWGEKAPLPFKGRYTVEAMCSSVALTERLEMITGKQNLSRASLADLDDDHEIWNHAADGLANLATTLILTTSVEKIVFGGGVMNRKCLLKKIRERTLELLNGYLDLPDISTLITESSYGPDVGLISAVLLAQQAHQSSLSNGESIEKCEGTPSMYQAGFLHGIIFGLLIAVAGAHSIHGSSKR